MQTSCTPIAVVTLEVVLEDNVKHSCSQVSRDDRQFFSVMDVFGDCEFDPVR